ncbi:flagellar hook-basal body protein [Pleionea sp. CnH1-48]|uniref:flagellar hook-basal body protein n=1 Tax=Pleionea sp. CnH1-48 TaxID=2954494 RepID=UPI002096DA8F|nr:flagellar hook-basal body complex protein [Pleionea sp. CnH1-48]MCO7223720.1 flagellar hook-basal body complex protein [Pleionea sp. CnH1-48]
MINSLYIAETGLNAQKTLVDVISNNIANVNTAGYKKAQVNFVDLVYNGDVNKLDKDPAAGNVSGELQGVHVSSIQQDLSSGNLKFTQHPFDLAIQGEGFIAVDLKEGSTGYTRVGRLRIDQDGFLTTTQGHRLSNMISVPSDIGSIAITQDGTVRGLVDGEPDWIDLGQIELSRFVNASALVAQGDGVFLATEEAGLMTTGIAGEDGMGNLLQGYTEESNVSMVEEMVNLVVAQRGYQLNARVIQVSDQLMETINNLSR